MQLSTISIVMGCVALLAGATVILYRDRAKNALLKLPRSKVAAAVLLLMALPWAAYELIHMPPFVSSHNLQTGILIAAPITFFLLLVYVDELLTPRAVGGLLMLAANPMLTTARWHESSLRIVVPLIAYVLIIEGMVLVLNPYRMRRQINWLLASEGRGMASGIVGCATGLTLLVLGFTVY